MLINANTKQDKPLKRLTATLHCPDYKTNSKREKGAPALQRMHVLQNGTALQKLHKSTEKAPTHKSRRFYLVN